MIVGDPDHTTICGCLPRISFALAPQAPKQRLPLIGCAALCAGFGRGRSGRIRSSDMLRDRPAGFFAADGAVAGAHRSADGLGDGLGELSGNSCPDRHQPVGPRIRTGDL
jgi:hypothetical protein